MDPLLIFFLLALIFSIIVHEVSHGFAAELQGDPTARLQGRLTLNPIPHIDPIGSVLIPAILVFANTGFLFGWAKPVPYNPYNLRNQKWGEAIVAAAGPGVNILLALVFGTVVRFGTGALPPAFIELAGVVVFINIMLAFFNLIPIPPLDGSKLLKSILPYRASLAFQRFETLLMSGGILITLLFFWLMMQLVGGYFFLALTSIYTLFTGHPSPFS
ncbi:MAG: Peptidase M50 [Parcubacteria group bacterium GW2011_GWD2_42_14]|nr:MAG: Peptidase M50 [Parcubacteria group bacterium GW2011_GWD2_42_14]